MGFSFENQGTTTYLVYAVEEDDVIDSMSLGMLTNNKIPGLAPAIFIQLDSQKYIKYNVSAKISVKQFFEGQVNKKRLLGVFNGIVDAMLSAEEYMIDTNTILLDLNYFFADVSTCETELVCLPVVGKDNRAELSTFFKTIMFSTQFDQTENCDHVAKIINYLNSTQVFSLLDFKSVLDSLSGQAVGMQQNNVPPRGQAGHIAMQQSYSQQGMPKPVQPSAHNTVPPMNVQPTYQQPVMPQPPVQPQPQQRVVQPPVPQQRPVQPQVNTFVMPPMQMNSAAPVQTEKPMSMFTLLMHYSKENKAIYDSQKELRKNNKNNKNKVKAPAPQAQPKKKQANAGFAIPGGNNNTEFVIPGQAAPQMNTAAGQQNNPAQYAASQPAKQPYQPQAAQRQYQQPQVQQQPVQQPQVQQPQQQPVQKSFTQPAYMPDMQPQGTPASFGDTTILGSGAGIGETTVLGASSSQVQIQPHLIRIKNNEKIILNKPVFRLGKEKSYVDYFINDNTAVSRSHCNILTKNGQYFVVDTNSTNHTYVNGGMIQSNDEVPISHGTKIRLANEDFEFKLY